VPIKIKQSRDTGSIGYTRHRTKIIKIDTTQKTKKMSDTDRGPFPVADVDTFGRVNSFSFRVVS
jgi:hypothetical protein